MREVKVEQAPGHRQDQVSYSYMWILSESENMNLTLIFRYLVPNDLTSYHFNYIIRKRIKLPEKDSLYFFVNGRNLLKGGK